MVEVTQEAQKAALKHLGYDSMEDAHYWAKDDYDLNRLDALIAVIDEAIATALAAERAKVEKLQEALALYAVDQDCDLCERTVSYGDAARAALTETQPDETGRGVSGPPDRGEETANATATAPDLSGAQP